MTADNNDCTLTIMNNIVEKKTIIHNYIFNKITGKQRFIRHLKGNTFDLELYADISIVNKNICITEILCELLLTLKKFHLAK